MIEEDVNTIGDFNQDSGFDGADQIGAFEALQDPTKYNTDYPPQ
jgi:hypothetical protein